MSFAIPVAALIAVLVGSTSTALASATPAPVSITLAWDASTDPTVAGYRLHEGVVSLTYTNVIDTGTETSVTVSNLMPGVTYYFAVSDYTSDGTESPLSPELSYTVPMISTGPVTLQMTMTSAKQFTLTATAPAGYAYDVLATQDLINWTTIGSATVNADGTLQFTDPGAATNASRFYRLRRTSP
jgi:hypothetical protein